MINVLESFLYYVHKKQRCTSLLADCLMQSKYCLLSTVYCLLSIVRVFFVRFCRFPLHLNTNEEEEESLFNRKYMVWETSIKTTYGRWHRGHPFDGSVQFVFEMNKYIPLKPNFLKQSLRVENITHCYD